ncbi:MAG: hypothetical protein ACYDIC_17625, partial [Desulfobaccales bacterium]
ISLALPPQTNSEGTSMGTSSARRAPTTWFWRRAKGAATRYLSPPGGAGLEAREVVARYLAALGEDTGSGSPGLLAAFRLTRKAAQTLGAFAAQSAPRGGDMAMEAGGGPQGPSRQEVAPAAMAGMLLEPDGSLEGAVARSALAAVLQDLGRSQDAASAKTVTRFLAESLYQRLVLDLGEPLEAASLSFGHWRQALEGLKGWIAGAAQEEPQAPPTPERWRGLAGWAWVTLTLEKMLGRLRGPSSPQTGEAEKT